MGQGRHDGDSNYRRQPPNGRTARRYGDALDRSHGIKLATGLHSLVRLLARQAAQQHVASEISGPTDVDVLTDPGSHIGDNRDGE